MPKSSTKTDAEKAAIQKAKADKFVELGNARLGKALAAIANIGGLSNRASYVYTPAQCQAILDALTKEVQKTMQKFVPGSASTAPAIDLGAVQATEPAQEGAGA